MASEITYVTDTHSLIWHLTASPRLGDGARFAFGQVGRGEATLFVPAIVVAELIFVFEKRRIQAEFDKIFERIRNNPAIEVTPLTIDLVIAMRDTTTVPEMHDRLIVCEAKARGAKLITRDAEIQRSKMVETVW